MNDTWDDPAGPLWDSDAPDDVWDFILQRKKHRMNLQIDDVLGFGMLLRAAATENMATLVAAKYDPTDVIASTAADATALGTAKAQAKAAQMAATDKVNAADALKDAHYTELSSMCDTMAGAVGKTTPLGKSFLKIRSNLKGRGPNPPPTPPAPPAP